MNKSEIEFANEQANKMSDVLKGQWVFEHGLYGAMICSNCGHEALLEKSRISTNLLYAESKFCPNCGADMRGESYES